jgi:hypothetical protein
MLVTCEMDRYECVLVIEYGLKSVFYFTENVETGGFGRFGRLQKCIFCV